MRKIFILIICLICLSFISAFDNQTIQICGGDLESLVLCVGDLENSPIGKNIYTAPSITPSTGGATSVTGSVFDQKIICNKVNDFLIEDLINEDTKKELLIKINNESKVYISKSVLDQYINNFEEKCNMTIIKKDVIKKVAFPFLLFLIIGMISISYYHRKIIIKFILVFFDDEDDLLEYLEGD